MCARSLTRRKRSFLSSGLSQGIDTGLRKMLNMPEQQQTDWHCTDCGMKLRGDGDIVPGRDDNEPYCEDCYAVRWKLGDCAGCRKPVLGLGREYVADARNFWHADCYRAAGINPCAACGVSIAGAVVEALGRKYHPACFECSTCHQKIESTFVVGADGRPVCKACSDAAKQQEQQLLQQRPSLGVVPLAAAPDNSDAAAQEAAAAAAAAVRTRELNNAAALERQRELEAIKAGMAYIDINETCVKCGEVMHTAGVRTPNVRWP